MDIEFEKLKKKSVTTNTLKGRVRGNKNIFKVGLMMHFITVFTVCQSACLLRVSSIQRINASKLPSTASSC